MLSSASTREPAPEAAAPARTRALVRGVRAALFFAVLVIVGVSIARDLPSVSKLSPVGSTRDLLFAAGAAIVGYLALPTSLPVLLVGARKYDRRQAGFYYRIWLQAFFYRYIPGKVALLAERVRLGRFAGLTASTSVLLLAWETPLLVLGASVVCGACLMPAFTGMMSSRAVLAYLLLAPVLAFASLLCLPHALKWLASKPSVRARVGDLGALEVPAATQMFVTLVFAIAWLGLGSSFFFVARYFVGIGAERFALVVFWFVASYVAGFVATIAPAGLGVREGLLVFGLAPMLPPAQAAVVAVAARIFMTAIEVLVVGAARCIPPRTTEAPHAA